MYRRTAPSVYRGKFTPPPTVDGEGLYIDDDAVDIDDIEEEDEFYDEELESYHQIVSMLGWGDEDSANYETYQELSSVRQELLDNIAELEENAQAMHDKEQSLENKLIGAAGIGLTGIGLMNTMSAMAEQKADQASEEDMKAYLATFTCDYGQGRNIKGGEMNVALPGGNELTALVTEYKALAASVKERKEALGMAPGIESEEIIDAAETGLYDNVALGRQDGAYASLSRALTDENSADAAAWNKQKEDTANKLKTGAITATVGAVGSLVANMAVNHNAPKNRSDELLRKRDDIKSKVQNKIRDEIARCNQEIARAHELVDEIKADSRLMANPELAEYVEAVKDLEPLSKDEDILQFLEHPLCF